jgi:dihydropyrimidinase
MYGLYPRKGTLAIGSDADIVIFDPDAKRVIRSDQLHHNVDYTPYEGLEIMGWPVTVLSRGELVIENEMLVATAGRGEFLPCSKPDMARPKVV